MIPFVLTFPFGTSFGSFTTGGGSYVGSSAGAGGVNPPVQAFMWFVDSVAGDDGNSGRSAGEAIQTLAELVTKPILDWHQIGLKCGSYWRESLDLSAWDHTRLATYGAGALPVIDGADVVTGWVAEGTANVWQKSVTPETSEGRLTAYEDGILLTRVADAAACSAAPGSFVDLHGFAGAPVTVKIHATDSGDPNTNGKSYEVALRHLAYHAGQGCEVEGIETARVLSNNGSLDLVGHLDSTMRRSVAVYGTKHSTGIGSGYYRDTVCVFADQTTAYEPSNTAFVSYRQNPTGLGVLMEGCGVIGQGRESGIGSAMYAHGDGAERYATITLRQFFAVDYPFASLPTADTVLAEGVYCQDCGQFAGGSSGGDTTIRYQTTISPGTGTGVVGLRAEIEDSVFFLANRNTVGNFNEIFRPQGGALTRCAFDGLTANTNVMANPSAGVHVGVSFTVFVGGVAHIWLAADGSYTGDFNVFLAKVTGVPDEVFHCHDGTAYRVTLLEWQIATGEDANSVTLAHADQGAGNPLAFWLGVATSANNGPADGDWRINPGARVYDAAGTPFIGTFADGTTPITLAGPQRHWDWNARVAVDGPPEENPTVPETLSQARTYCADPDGWVF